MEDVSECLVCGSKKFSPFIKCTDFTVSKLSFTINECSSCGFKFTNPRPTLSEIGPYYKSDEYVSHSNTKKGIVNSLYHWVRSYTLIKKLQLVMHHSVSRGTILDYGCGTGAFLGTCKKNKWDAHGIEPDEMARKVALEQNQVAPCPSLSDWLNSNPEIKIDVITMWHVLEHVHDVDALFGQLKQILKESGTLIIAVPNCSSYDAKYYKEYWAAYDVPRHLYHFEPKQMAMLLQKHGFKQKTVLPMVFDSYYVSMLSEKYKTGKARILKGFWIGLKSNLKANKHNKRFSSQIYIFKR